MPMRNEHFDEYPDGLIDNVKNNVEEIRGLNLVQNYHLYIYLEGRYGDALAMGKYAKESPHQLQEDLKRQDLEINQVMKRTKST